MERLLTFVGYVLLLASIPLASALKFDLEAHHHRDSQRHERCIRNFVAKEQLVVVTAILSGYRGDGQVVNMHVCAHTAGNDRLGLWSRIGQEAN